MTDESPVERYYERNTRRFLRFGGGRSSGAIHRQLWGPGVTATEQAADYINVLVAAAIRDAGRSVTSVIDFGCGVGGTAIHLASALPAVAVTGITLSAKQAAIARREADRQGVGDRCVFRQGDFESADLGLTADVIVAIESYVHSAEPALFFANAAAHLDTGGLLFVVDDFLAGSVDADSFRLTDQFRRGWRAPAFTTVADCASYAAHAGFGLVEDRELTPLIRLDRPRDRAIAIVAPLVDRLGLAHSPFCGNLIGGSALREGLRSNRFGYHWLGFRRA